MVGQRTHGDGQPHGFVPFIDCLSAFDKPLIAAVNGVGVGIGLTMLLHCDIVYIARSARLRAPFVSLGLVPEAASSYLLQAIVGPQPAADLLYTNAWIDAGRAVELKLAAAAFDDAELLPAAMRKAAEIAQQPLASLRRTKQTLLAVRADAVAAARRREDAGDGGGDRRPGQHRSDPRISREARAGLHGHVGRRYCFTSRLNATWVHGSFSRAPYTQAPTPDP